MKLSSSIALLFLLGATPASADFFGCTHSEPHRLTAAVGGATTIVVIARAGSLRITGADTSVVTATGTACSSDRDFLGQMRIVARKDGSELRIEAEIPERTVVFGFHVAKLDLELTVPAGIPLRVKDGSGPVEIRNVAALEIDDGSGEIEIRGVRGALDVRDGSGSIMIEDVGGDVRLRDGSGSIEIEKVRGSVLVVEDGSGSMDIRHVEGDVTIERDGSGSIDVSDVRGNLTVERDGSGGLRYRRIGGTVSVPRRH